MSQKLTKDEIKKIKHAIESYPMRLRGSVHIGSLQLLSYIEALEEENENLKFRLKLQIKREAESVTSNEVKKS